MPGIPKDSRNTSPSKAMLLDSIAGILKGVFRSRRDRSRGVTAEEPVVGLKSVGFDDFLAINMPPREMLLHPILPERSLAMLYAPRGIGKTLLALSIGLAVAGGCPLLRWNAPRQRRVLYVDGALRGYGLLPSPAHSWTNCRSGRRQLRLASVRRAVRLKASLFLPSKRFTGACPFNTALIT
jgi:hypothetical protein